MLAKPDVFVRTRDYRWSSWLWTFGATLLVLGLAYAPNFLDLWSIWSRDPNFSHGMLVVPVAAFIFWRRLSIAEEQPALNTSATAWRGCDLLAVILVLRVCAYEANARWSENATIVLAVTCLAWIVAC